MDGFITKNNLTVNVLGCEFQTKSGARGEIRTRDLGFTKALLYRLSYSGIFPYHSMF